MAIDDGEALRERAARRRPTPWASRAPSCSHAKASTCSWPATPRAVREFLGKPARRSALRRPGGQGKLVAGPALPPHAGQAQARDHPHGPPRHPAGGGPRARRRRADAQALARPGPRRRRQAGRRCWTRAMPSRSTTAPSTARSTGASASSPISRRRCDAPRASWRARRW